MSGALTPLPNTPSWHGAQLKKSTGTPLPFYTKNLSMSIFTSNQTQNFSNALVDLRALLNIKR